jgi:hypothetical protein
MWLVWCAVPRTVAAVGGGWVTVVAIPGAMLEFLCANLCAVALWCVLFGALSLLVCHRLCRALIPPQWRGTRPHVACSSCGAAVACTCGFYLAAMSVAQWCSVVLQRPVAGLYRRQWAETAAAGFFWCCNGSAAGGHCDDGPGQERTVSSKSSTSPSTAAGTDLLRAVSVPSDLRGGWCVVCPDRSFSM